MSYPYPWAPVGGPIEVPARDTFVVDEATFINSSATADIALWERTASGTPGAATVSNAAGEFIISEATGATATNHNQYQVNGEAFKAADDRNLDVFGEFSLADVSETIFGFGLFPTGSDVLGVTSNAVVSATLEGIGFFTQTSDGVLYYHVGTGSTRVTESTGITLADDEYVQLAIKVEGRKLVTFGVRVVGRVEWTFFKVREASGAIPTGELTLTRHYEADSSAAQTVRRKKIVASSRRVG